MLFFFLSKRTVPIFPNYFYLITFKVIILLPLTGHRLSWSTTRGASARFARVERYIQSELIKTLRTPSRRSAWSGHWAVWVVRRDSVSDVFAQSRMCDRSERKRKAHCQRTLPVHPASPSWPSPGVTMVRTELCF